MEYFLLTISVLFIIFVKCLDKNPPPIFGIYERKDGRYFFKVIFMYLILTFQQIKLKCVKKRPLTFYHLENSRELSSTKKPNNFINLDGASKIGDHFNLKLVTQNDSIDGYMLLKVNDSNLGVLVCKQFTNTTSTCELIKLTPIEPLKKWRLVYRGKMHEFKDDNKINDKDIYHQVEIDGIWSSNLPPFDVNAKEDPLNLAKCLAYEKWHKGYFQNLTKLNSTYYEQYGTLQLKVSIERKIYYVKLDTLTGNSLGHISNQIFKASIHTITTENGDNFSIQQICAPTFFSRLLIGFVYIGKENKTYAIQKCSLKLYKYGGISDPPKDYGFTMSAGNKSYFIQVKAIETPYIYSGQYGDVKNYLQTSSFRVNGAKGWGTSKWVYKNNKA